MKKVLIIALFLSLTQIVFSQIDYYEQPNLEPQDTTKRTKTKLLFGGDFSLILGTYSEILIAPKILYPVKDWLSVGGGIDFIYYKDYQNENFLYGANIFSELYPLSFLTIHAEGSLTNIKNYYKRQDIVWYPTVYIGGGYKLNISSRSFVNLLVLWNLNQTEYSIYTNPIFRLSFYF